MMKKTLIATCGLLIAASACIVAQAASPAPSTPPSGAPAAPPAVQAGQAQPPQAQAPGQGGRQPAAQPAPGGCPNQAGSQHPAPGQPGAPGPAGQPPQGGAGQPAATPGPAAQVTPDPSGYTVVISGGYDTDPQDHGRPVVLIASALGVPTEVFREAFSGVTPAGAGSSPTDTQARSNKAALMQVLEPYGITNDRLDEVSNYYRYTGSKGEMWKYTAASAKAVVQDGTLTGIDIVNPGAGYSSAPTVTIIGPNGTVTATAIVTYTQDFATNGSIASIALN